MTFAQGEQQRRGGSAPLLQAWRGRRPAPALIVAVAVVLTAVALAIAKGPVPTGQATLNGFVAAAISRLERSA